ncbi:MAG: BON domain-containing protein [Alphaproteobacteria bacterium]
MTVVAMTHAAEADDRIVAKLFPGLGQNRNTQKTAPEVRADIPVDAAESPAVHEIDASHRALADERTEARITAALRNAGAIKSRAGNIYVSVSDGIVRLYGAVRDSGAAREIEQAVRTGATIDAVQNDIQTIGGRVSD